MIKKKTLTGDEIIRRRASAQAFMSSEFYMNYFEPKILEKIADVGNVSGIDDSTDEKILSDFRSKKNKVTIYRGVLTMINEWATKSYKGGK